MDFAKINIHNQHRLFKQQKIRDGKFKNQTPKKISSKNSVINRVKRIEKKMGYHFQDNGSLVLRRMKEEFREKTIKYLGGGQFAKKQTRMDKVKMKDQLGFKNQANPILKSFAMIERRIKKQLLSSGFAALKE